MVATRHTAVRRGGDSLPTKDAGLSIRGGFTRIGGMILRVSEAFSKQFKCTLSHVIKAMGYSDDEANEAIRLSWCHLTPDVDWEAVAGRILSLR